MPKITILANTELCPQGAQLNANSGDNLCQTLLNNKIEIEHACDMACACTTCHVIIKSGFNSLNPPKEQEEDLLDMAWGLTATSRLACQVTITQEDLVIELPKYTINHARET